MSTLSPAPADAGHQLYDDLYVHLHEAEYLAEQDGERSADDMETARKLIGDLVLVIRGLLVEHRPQSSGDCRICTSAWPCPVVTTIYATVKDPRRQFVALVLRQKMMGDRHYSMSVDLALLPHDRVPLPHPARRRVIQFTPTWHQGVNLGVARTRPNRLMLDKR